MTPCGELQEYVFTHGPGLPPGLAEHAQRCPDCATFVREFEAMQGLVVRAKAQARALPDLDPAAWARVRVAAEGSRGPARDAPWRRWAWSVAAVAALGVTGWALWVGSPAGRRHVGPAAAAKGGAVARSAGTGGAAAGRGLGAHSAVDEDHAAPPASPGALERSPRSPDPAALTVLVSGAFAAGHGQVVEGATVQTTDSPATVHAFGRHLIQFAPHAVVRVAAWEPDRVELDVQRGAIRCDVERARDAERFLVRAGDAEVRVLGTIFTVARAGGTVSVAVQRGRVAVARSGQPDVSVGAGERWARGALWTGGAAGPSSAEPPPRTAALAATPRRPGARRPRLAASAPAGRAGVGGHANGRAPARRDQRTAPPAEGAESSEHVVEIDVPDQQAAPPAAPVSGSVRKLLVPIVAQIRGGGCARAVPRLREIARAFAERSPPDVLYLLGWCYRHQGKGRAADAFFARYRSSVAVPRWPLPRGVEDELPLPSSARLAP